jgi:hypothetical protein
MRVRSPDSGANHPLPLDLPRLGPPIIESPRILREETGARNTKNFKRDRRIRHQQAIFAIDWDLDSRTEN